MKYRVTNYTTLEILETDNIATAYEWTSDWASMNHDVEMVDNTSGEVIVDTRKGDQIMKTINEMITEISNKYGENSREALVMKLMVISYRSHQKYTANDIIKTYKKLIKNA